MQVIFEERDGRRLVRLAGEMTIYEAAELKARFSELLLGAGELEIDLSEVQEFDTAGVQMLLWLRHEGDLRKQTVRFAQPSRVVSELVGLYNLGAALGQST